MQRLSNNCRPKFTDEEIITIYLWGIMRRQFEGKAIYHYTRMHLLEWFPNLPSYQAFSRRLCELAPAFETLACRLICDLFSCGVSNADLLVDSMPVIVSKGRRSGSAKVARELCSKTYCASREEWYYGLKLHALAASRPQAVPFPCSAAVTTASEHDLPCARQMVENLDVHHCRIIADKAYCDATWEKELLSDRNVVLCTPRKKPKGITETLVSSNALDTSISIKRQPIESFFSWIQAKTGIQIASKVRSLKGLLLHTFGKLAAAIAMLYFNFNY